MSWQEWGQAVQFRKASAESLSLRGSCEISYVSGVVLTRTLSNHFMYICGAVNLHCAPQAVLSGARYICILTRNSEKNTECMQPNESRSLHCIPLPRSRHFMLYYPDSSSRAVPRNVRTMTRFLSAPVDFQNTTGVEINAAYFFQRIVICCLKLREWIAKRNVAS